MEKSVTGECSGCESSFEVAYVEELVSQDLPEYCPFCGDVIETVIEQSYIEDEDDEDNDGRWD
jgi:hypothetical protein